MSKAPKRRCPVCYYPANPETKLFDRMLDSALGLAVLGSLIQLGIGTLIGGLVGACLGLCLHCLSPQPERCAHCGHLL